MTTQLPLAASAYLRSINNHDAAAFIDIFTDDAIVRDAGREFRGREAIKAWSDREIFGAAVTLDVLNVEDRGDETIVTTKVDGNFDRTGLPDPVIINQHIIADGARIARLTCLLAAS